MAAGKARGAPSRIVNTTLMACFTCYAKTIRQSFAAVNQCEPSAYYLQDIDRPIHARFTGFE